MNYKDDKNYMRLIPLLLNVEGGFSNDPDDPGGPTNRGIAWAYQKNNLAEMGVHSVKQLEGISKEFAEEFYYRFFWKECGADKLQDLKMACLHFDIAVNSGIGTAVSMIKRLSKNPVAFEANGKNIDLHWHLFFEYFVDRLSFYSHAKLRKKYLEGWVNRLVILGNEVVDKM